MLVVGVLNDIYNSNNNSGNNNISSTSCVNFNDNNNNANDKSNPSNISWIILWVTQGIIMIIPALV